MDDFKVLKISPRFRLEIEPGKLDVRLSDKDQKRVEELWQKEVRAKGNAIYNGDVLTCVSHNSSKIVAKQTEYKYFLAQIRDPSLRQVLNIRPIGLSALTHTGNNIIIGKRAGFVTQYPGKLELAPSGAVEPGLNLKAQFLKELDEETGITENFIKNFKLIAVIEDLRDGLVEICAEITAKPSFLSLHSREYDQLMTIPEEEFTQFIQSQGDNFVPLSLELLRIKHLIN